MPDLAAAHQTHERHQGCCSAKPETNSGGSGHRLFLLDVLRGIAAILVLLRHVPRNQYHRSGPMEWLMASMEEVGWVGVDLFFTLSGFLIAGLIFRELDTTGRIGIGRFWWRRGMKIWPSYYFIYGGMVLMWCLAGWQRGWQPWQDDLAWDTMINAVFLQNYVPVFRWPHSWSLAVEEHFYIVLPLVLLLAVSWLDWSRLRCCIPWCVLLVCVSTLFARWTACRHEYNWAEVYYPTHFRADSLAFGVLMAYAFRYWPPVREAAARSRGRIAIAGVCVLAVPYFFPLETDMRCGVWGFTALYLAFGILVLAAAAEPELPPRTPRPIRAVFETIARVGLFSYTIYLAHAVVPSTPGFSGIRRGLLEWVATVWGEGSLLQWTNRLYFWAPSILLGVLLAIVIERPVLRWRDRNKGTQVVKSPPVGVTALPGQH